MISRWAAKRAGRDDERMTRIIILDRRYDAWNVIHITHNGIELSDNPSILVPTGETAWGFAPVPKSEQTE